MKWFRQRAISTVVSMECGRCGHRSEERAENSGKRVTKTLGAHKWISSDLEPGLTSVTTSGLSFLLVGKLRRHKEVAICHVQSASVPSFYTLLYFIYILQVYAGLISYPMILIALFKLFSIPLHCNCHNYTWGCTLQLNNLFFFLNRCALLEILNYRRFLYKICI